MLFNDLCKEFEKISQIDSLCKRQYALIELAQKSGLTEKSSIELFRFYIVEREKEKMLKLWYLSPWIRFEILCQKLAGQFLLFLFTPLITQGSVLTTLGLIRDIGNITLIITVISLLWNSFPNLNREIEQAWKDAESKDSGRITRANAIKKLYLYKQVLSGMTLPSGAYLDKINLEGAFLDDSALPKSHLWGANLKKTRLSGANLNGSNLFLANLENAYLYRANLQAANLSSTHLYKANFSLANLAKTNLFSANLKGADLSGTNLSNSNLGNANFEGAKNLSIEQVKSACFWQTAKFDLPFQKLLYQTPESSVHRNLCLKLWFYIPSTSTQ